MAEPPLADRCTAWGEQVRVDMLPVELGIDDVVVEVEVNQGRAFTPQIEQLLVIPSCILGASDHSQTKPVRQSGPVTTANQVRDGVIRAVIGQDDLKVLETLSAQTQKDGPQVLLLVGRDEGGDVAHVLAFRC